MKTILLLMILSTPGLCHSQNKFWFSNKVEVGYGKAFISEQISFKGGTFIKNTVGIGLKLKASKKVSYQTHYLLENAEKNNWCLSYFVGARLSFKF